MVACYDLHSFDPSPSAPTWFDVSLNHNDLGLLTVSNSTAIFRVPEQAVGVLFLPIVVLEDLPPPLVELAVIGAARFPDAYSPALGTQFTFAAWVFVALSPANLTYFDLSLFSVGMPGSGPDNAGAVVSLTGFYDTDGNGTRGFDADAMALTELPTP